MKSLIIHKLGVIVIVDASYWSFSGINDFQKDLNLNNKIRERIRDDIEFFVEQEIDKVEQLLDREQEFFQGVEDKENTLARQLIQQEIEDFIEKLIGEISNSRSKDFKLSDRRDFNLSDQLSAKQLEVSEKLIGPLIGVTYNF